MAVNVPLNLSGAIRIESDKEEVSNNEVIGTRPNLEQKTISDFSTIRKHDAQCLRSGVNQL